MRHPFWKPGLGSSGFAFGLANTAIEAYTKAMNGVAQQRLDRDSAAAAAQAVFDYTDNNLTMMDACDMDTSKAQDIFDAAKRLRDLLAPSLPSTDREADK